MRCVSKSDVGRNRKTNEDHFHVAQDEGIFLLADGMGGHQAGEVASKLAVETVYGHLRERVGLVNTEKEIFKLLAEAFFEAHRTIRDKAESAIELIGMGTTLIAMILRGARVYLCHVGDSRAYILGDGIRQITNDHTMGAYLVEQGIASPEEVPEAEWHSLTQAVGVAQYLVPEMSSHDLRDGDCVLLCSDGLSDVLGDEEILKIFKNHRKKFTQLAGALVKRANRKNSPDNITAIVISPEGGEIASDKAGHHVSQND